MEGEARPRRPPGRRGGGARPGGWMEEKVERERVPENGETRPPFPSTPDLSLSLTRTIRTAARPAARAARRVGGAMAARGGARIAGVSILERVWDTHPLSPLPLPLPREQRRSPAVSRLPRAFHPPSARTFPSLHSPRACRNSSGSPLFRPFLAPHGAPARRGRPARPARHASATPIRAPAPPARPARAGTACAAHSSPSPLEEPHCSPGWWGERWRRCQLCISRRRAPRP